MNVRDSEVVCGLLEKAGYQLIDSIDEADIVLFNTCSVRQHAEDKVWSEIGNLWKKCRPRPKQKVIRQKPVIGIIGCMAQNYKEKVFERSEQVDFVAGPADIYKIPEILDKFGKKNAYELKIWETDSLVRPEEIYHTGFYQDKKRAFVVISEGCENFCSYCVVPYVRGALRNRKPQDIIREIEEAVDKGIFSFTLLGQNVNAYRYEQTDFIKLLERVDLVRGVKEFNFVTSHPKDTSLELFKAMAGLQKLNKYLHLPVQSGSDRILKLMNRGYTCVNYLELVEIYRKIVEDGLLSTDIILGFPTEKEDDFQNTFNLLKRVQFDSAYIFKYSPRPGTKALDLADDVSKAEKERRHALALELQREISRNKKK